MPANPAHIGIVLNHRLDKERPIKQQYVELNAVLGLPGSHAGNEDFRQPRTSSSGSSVRRRNSTIIASSTGVSTVLMGLRGPMGASAVVVRDLHLATVARLRP